MGYPNPDGVLTGPKNLYPYAVGCCWGVPLHPWIKVVSHIPPAGAFKKNAGASSNGEYDLTLSLSASPTSLYIERTTCDAKCKPIL